jgi:hypothetical protein
LSFHASRDVFRVLQVALENLQAGFQERLEFGIAGRRNERVLQRAVDYLW